MNTKQNFQEIDFNKQLDSRTWSKVLSFAKIYKKTMILLGLFMMFVAAVEDWFSFIKEKREEVYHDKQ